MAKRVALDTLEAEALEIPLPDRTVSVEEVDDEKVGKRPLPQWLLISALALVILIVAGGIFYWFMRPQKTVAHAPTQGLPAAVPLPPAPLTVQVNDFIIPLQNHLAIATACKDFNKSRSSKEREEECKCSSDQN